VVRAARPEDSAEIGRIAEANGQSRDYSGRDLRYVAHLTRHGRLLVAETGTGLAGFAATRWVGGATLLCDLFVEPASHGAGIGRRLLDRIFDGSTERVTFSSQDPRALPLYARYGLAPRWPLLYLIGDPAALPVTAAHAVPWLARAVRPGDAAAAELALTGVDRGPDYAYWGSLPGSGGILVEQAHDVLAAGAIGPDQLRHLAVADAADPAATVLTALSAFGSPAVRLCLPGPHPALGPLLRSGFRIEDFDHYMSTGEGLMHSGDVLSPALA
jgi:GNAT superfamily N-acetyltransferase